MKLSAVLCYICCCCLVLADQTNNRGNAWASNVLGSAQEHASFSFVRPGLTQTAFAFNGPSSHQMFSATYGNPYLTQKVLPNIADALAYRNPGLGVHATAPAINVGPYFATTDAAGRIPSPLIATAPMFVSSSPETTVRIGDGNFRASPFLPQHVLDNYSNIRYGPLGRLVYTTSVQDTQAERQVSTTEAPAQTETQAQEEIQQAQEERPVSQNLLGVAFSSAPSVAHVQVTGNGYKFNF